MEPAPRSSADAVPRIVLGTRIRRFSGALIVSNGPATFELEGSGAFIFRNLDGRSTVGQIATRLAETYDAEESDVLGDTVAFVEWLAGEGIVSVDRS